MHTLSTIFSRLGLLVAILVLVGQGCISVGPRDDIETAGPAGMFVSTNQGEDWRPISLLPTAEGTENINGVSVYRIFEDPTDSKAMYWASRANGLFFSYDDGRTWRHAENEISVGFVYAVAVDPKDKCNIVVTNGRLAFRTTDCTRTWKEVHREDNPKERINSIAYDPLVENRMYMAKTGGQILVSNDNGISWSVVHRFRRARLEKIIPDPFTTSTLYVASRSDYLQISRDGGVTWESTEEQMDSFPKADEYRRFFHHPNKQGVLYWISTYGILVSEDRGATWEAMELITPPGSVDIYGFAVNPQNDDHIYYTGTFSGRSTFYRSFDGGKTWETRKLPSGQIPTALRVHPENGEWVYVGFTIPPQS